MKSTNNSFQNILSLMEQDALMSEEEIDALRNGTSLEDIFNKAKKKVSSKEEEILLSEERDNFITSLLNSVESMESIIFLLKDAVSSKENSQIKNSLNVFNRSAHTLKSQVMSYGAYTIGDILHAIEDVTTENSIDHNKFNPDDLYDFIKRKIDEVKNYSIMIKDEVYEIEVNKNKELMNSEEISKSKGIYNNIPKYIKDFKENVELDLNSAHRLSSKIEELMQNVRHSRYREFLREIQKEIMEVSKNVDNEDNKIKEKINNEKVIIIDKIKVAEKMLDYLIENDSDYYNKAISESTNKDVARKKSSYDSVSMDLPTLNNILLKIDEAKIENTQIENAIKTSESNSKSTNFLIDMLIKTLQYFETFSDSKIQSLSNDVIKDDELFDPLEMDNYTELQEKTKSMREVLVDLKNIGLAEEKNISVIKAANKLMESALHKTNDSLMSSRLKTVNSYLSGTITMVVNSSAKELGKDIDLEIKGDHLEIDSVIMEKLKPPLLHTLRNSVAHGIESKEDRIALGKPPKGKISCLFEQKNGKLTITLKDDGAGINVRKVEEKAREKGIWTSNKTMTDQQAIDIICMPEFSTLSKEQVNQVSGRGVGMDVVKNEIIKLNGRYDIVSKEGKGLDITIQIPTSLSNKEVLLVSCAKQKFAIPIEIFADNSIYEQQYLKQCEKEGRINFKGHEVDFRYLSDLVKIHSDDNDKSECSHVLLLSDTGNLESGIRIAVAVEKISKEMVTQVPIKTIGRTLSNVPGVVATTILSDGSATFIYDPVRAKIALLKYYSVANINENSFLPIINKETNKSDNINNGLVMVVDDSTTVRKSIIRFLEKNGYNHISATDGENAKSKIINVKPDIILLDVEMPKMDGFEFAQFIRDNENYKDIPIIMITSRMADKHRNKAAQIGVNDYLGKPFNHEVLLKSMKRLLNK